MNSKEKNKMERKAICGCEIMVNCTQHKMESNISTTTSGESVVYNLVFERHDCICKDAGSTECNGTDRDCKNYGK